MAASVSGLHVPGETPLHQLQPQCKLAAAVLFVFVVVATPREQFWAFGLYAAAVVVVAAIARLTPALVLRRLTIETPFLAFALLLPLFAGGEQLGSGWWSLSIDGLWASWNIVAKGTIGVSVSVLLTATTPLPDLVHGLERLRLPALVVGITTFMVRYAEVIAGEMQRMKIARESRGHDPRWLWHLRPIAQSAGTLFIRSFERGERVHLAMASRGFDGRMPRLGAAATGREWISAAMLPTMAVVVASTAWLVHL